MGRFVKFGSGAEIVGTAVVVVGVLFLLFKVAPAKVRSTITGS